jgi:hypothetical protein
MRSGDTPTLEALEPRLSMSGDLSLYFPNNVEVGTPFQVQIAIDPLPPKPLDVKFSPQYIGTTTRANSDLLNETTGLWRSTHFYAADAYPSQSVFNVRINEEGPFDFFLKVRDNSGKIEQTSRPIYVAPEPGTISLLATAAVIPFVFEKKRKTA